MFHAKASGNYSVRFDYGRADPIWGPHFDTGYLYRGKHCESGISLVDPVVRSDRLRVRFAVGDFYNDGYDDLAGRCTV